MSEYTGELTFDFGRRSAVVMSSSLPGVVGILNLGKMKYFDTVLKSLHKPGGPNSSPKNTSQEKPPSGFFDN